MCFNYQPELRVSGSRGKIARGASTFPLFFSFYRENSIVHVALSFLKLFGGRTFPSPGEVLFRDTNMNIYKIYVLLFQLHSNYFRTFTQLKLFSRGLKLKSLNKFYY